MPLRFLIRLWRSLADDPEAVCALSLGNTVALCLLLLLDLLCRFGGR